jgi:hypothetical protein
MQKKLISWTDYLPLQTCHVRSLGQLVAAVHYEYMFYICILFDFEHLSAFDIQIEIHCCKANHAM